MHRFMLFVKFFVTGLIALLLIVPLVAISGLAGERQAASQQVVADIQRLGVGPQVLTGPILAVPFRRTSVTKVTDSRTGVASEVTNTTEGHLHFLPNNLSIAGGLETDMRHRGIYSVPGYKAQHRINGMFVVPERFGVDLDPKSAYEFGAPTLIFGVSDTRGISGSPSLAWDGANMEWKGGTDTAALKSGIHAQLGAIQPGRTVEFVIELQLRGMQLLEYVPVGKQTSIAMKSDWPHPSFSGQFLPESKEISASGFTANWRTSHLASNAGSAMISCLASRCDAPPTTVGVAFIEPVNIYLESERAVKYGFLFVAITFLIFQLFELLKKLAIHPVQYGLVGFALAMFFLLLLALTEHVPFAVAYLIASASCVGLLAFYVSFVLRSARRAAGFTAMLASLYGALYVLLQSEDMALLLGAVLMFVILAAVMIITRRVDWYGVTEPASGPDKVLADSGV